MAFSLRCPCGTLIAIADEHLSKWVACPRCKVVVYLPPEEGIQEPPAQPATVQAAAGEGSPDWGDSPAPVSATGKSLGAEIEVPDLETRFRKGEGKARRRYLRGVNRGLAFHYLVPFLFLTGTGSGVLGLVLTMSIHAFDWEKAAAAAGFFFLLSGILLFLTGALSAPAAIFGLLGGSPGGGGTLLTCLGLLAVGMLSAALMAVFRDYAPGSFVAALVTLFGAWACWMVFLSGLGPALRREEVAEGAMRTLWGGVRTLAISLPFLLVVGFLTAAMVYKPILVTVIPATFVGALVTIAYHAGGFDSILSLLLAPTGIPFTLEYLNFISGLRMLIQRRS